MAPALTQDSQPELLLPYLTTPPYTPSPPSSSLVHHHHQRDSNNTGTTTGSTNSYSNMEDAPTGALRHIHQEQEHSTDNFDHLDADTDTSIHHHHMHSVRLLHHHHHHHHDKFKLEFDQSTTTSVGSPSLSRPITLNQPTPPHSTDSSAPLSPLPGDKSFASKTNTSGDTDTKLPSPLDYTDDVLSPSQCSDVLSHVDGCFPLSLPVQRRVVIPVTDDQLDSISFLDSVIPSPSSPCKKSPCETASSNNNTEEQVLTTVAPSPQLDDFPSSTTTDTTTSTDNIDTTILGQDKETLASTGLVGDPASQPPPPLPELHVSFSSTEEEQQQQQLPQSEAASVTGMGGTIGEVDVGRVTGRSAAPQPNDTPPPPPPPPSSSSPISFSIPDSSEIIHSSMIFGGKIVSPTSLLPNNTNGPVLSEMVSHGSIVMPVTNGDILYDNLLPTLPEDFFKSLNNLVTNNPELLDQLNPSNTFITDASSLIVPTDTPALGSIHQHQDVTPAAGVFASSAAGVKPPHVHAPVMTPEQQAAALATSLSVRQLRLQKRQAQLLRRVRRVTGRGLAAVVSTQLQHLLSHGPTLLRREGRQEENHDHEADLVSTDMDAIALSAAVEDSAVSAGDGVHQPPRYDTRALRAMSTANLITYVRRMETRSTNTTTTTTTSTSNTISDTSQQPSNYSTSHLYSSIEAPVCNSYNSTISTNNTSKYSVAQPCLPESVRAELDTFVGEVTAAARLHVEHDSDPTESSSGGESCDELDGYDDESNTEYKPIRDRALYRHCSERAWIASRWTWLQAQLTDLECKIHQHNRAHMRLRHMSRSGSKSDLLAQHLLQQQTSLSGSIGVPGFLPSPAQLHRPSYTCLTRTTNINGFNTGVATAGTGVSGGGGGGADGTTSFNGAGHHYLQCSAAGSTGDEGDTSARTAGYRWHRKRRWIRVGNVFERGPACTTGGGGAGAAEARYSEKYGRTIRQPTFVAPCNCVYPYSCILCTRLSVKASSSVVQRDRNFIMNTCSNNNINYNSASISSKLQSPAVKMPPPILPPFSTISSSKTPSGQCSHLSPSSQSPPPHMNRSPYNHHSFTTNITFNTSNVERNLCKSFSSSNSNTNTTNSGSAGTPLKPGTSSFTTTTTTISDGAGYPYDSSAMNHYSSYGGTPYKTPSKSRPLNAVGVNSGGCITSLCKSAWFPRVATSSRTTLNRSAQRVPCQERMGACDPAYHPVLTHATEIPQSTRLETILKSRAWLQKLPGLYKSHTSPSKSGVHPCIKDESPSISGSSSVCTSSRHHGTDYTEEGSSGIGVISSRSYHRRASHSKKKKKNKDKDRGRSRDKEAKRKEKKKKGYKRRDKEEKKGRLTLRLRKSSVTGELVPTYGETSRGTDGAHRYPLESSDSPHDHHRRGCAQSSGSAYCDDSSSVCSSRASSPAPQYHQRGSSLAPQSLHGHQQHRGTSHPCAGDKGASNGGNSSKTAAGTLAYHHWDSSKVTQRGVTSHHESGTVTNSGKLSAKQSSEAATTSSVVVVPAPNSSAYGTRRASLYASTGSTTTTALTGAGGGVGASCLSAGGVSSSLQLTPAAAAAVAFKNKQSTASYDIDNIVIPYNMASVTRVEHIEYKEIVTPKWREVEELQPLDASDASLLEEDVTTPCVLARHARSEELERLRFAAHLSGGGGRHGGNARTRQRNSMGGPGSAQGGQGTSTGTNTPDNPLSPHTDVADMVSPIVTPPATPVPMSEDSNQSSTCSAARTQCRGANNSTQSTKQEDENSNAAMNKTAFATTSTTSSGGKSSHATSSSSTLVVTSASNLSGALAVTSKTANCPIVIFSPFLSELKKNNLATASNNSGSFGGGSGSDMETDISSCGALVTKTIVTTDQLAASSTNKCNNTDNCSSLSTSSSANRKLRSTNTAPRQRSTSNGPAAAAADEDGITLEQVSPYPSRRFPLADMAYATMLRENSEATVAQPPRHALLTSIDYDRMGDSSDDDDDKNEEEDDDGNCEDNEEDDEVAVTQSKTKRKVPDGGVTTVAPGAKRRNSSRSLSQQQHPVLTNYNSNKTAVFKQNDNSGKIGDTALIKLSGGQSVEQLRRSSVSLREHINKVGCIDGDSEGRSSPLSEVTDSAAEDDLTGELMLDDTVTPRPPDWTISATADAAGRCVMQVLRH